LRDIRPAVQYKRAAQMAFRMASMTRVKSGDFKARKGIPKDVRDDYQALYGVRWEELFRAPACAASSSQGAALRVGSRDR
jgi:hypothetical protein